MRYMAQATLIVLSLYLVTAYDLTGHRSLTQILFPYNRPGFWVGFLSCLVIGAQVFFRSYCIDFRIRRRGRRDGIVNFKAGTARR